MTASCSFLVSVTSAAAVSVSRFCDSLCHGLFGRLCVRLFMVSLTICVCPHVGLFVELSSRSRCRSTSQSFIGVVRFVTVSVTVCVSVCVTVSVAIFLTVSLSVCVSVFLTVSASRSIWGSFTVSESRSVTSVSYCLCLHP